MEALRTTYDSDDEAHSYEKPAGVSLKDTGNDADDEGMDDELAATL